VAAESSGAAAVETTIDQAISSAVYSAITAAVDGGGGGEGGGHRGNPGRRRARVTKSTSRHRFSRTSRRSGMLQVEAA